MNIVRWKGLVWLASLAAGGYLVYYVSDFLRHRELYAKGVSEQVLAQALDSIKKPDKPETDVVAYAQIQQVFHAMDWTGKPPPEQPKAATDEVRVVPKIAVSTLLKVQAIKVDTSEAKNSLAWVKFVDPKLTSHNSVKEDTILRVEERLFSPYQDVRIEAITAAGVLFAFDDAAREQETVQVSPYLSQRGTLGIVVVAPGGAILPQLQRRIVPSAGADVYVPGRTVQVRKNEYQIGTETLKDLDQDYSRILSQDVSYGTYRNPRTGAVEGIKVNRVAPNALPAQFGLTEGEVLKSINGHKVTSVNDAIAYVKANAEATDTWVALFEKQGREFTRTYHSPE